ncbi:AraC family transcriptional regulator [Massilia solisilvae]|uniref:AraC family transcriptional regulator n=1 Tax=Massilia solisilvae TaxID=1811225 RepID=A0ABT2BJW3_9BURK|nr:AraC family transcriptional regulator [Massilia solisilvae]MCS0608802.1 AraC family transcriptional regulator [Massilia solisilvae]
MAHSVFPSLMPADNVLSDYGLCQTSDIEEARSVGERIFCSNKIYSKDPKFNTRVNYRRVNSLGVGRMTYGGETVIDPDVMELFSLVQVPISGREFIESDGKRALFESTQGVVLNSHARTRIHHFGGDKIIIRVDNEVVRRQCQQHLGRTLHKDVEFDAVMNLDTPDGRNMVKMLAWMCDVLSTSDKLSPLLSTQFETTFVGMLLSCQPNNYSAELCEEKGQSIAPSFVKRIEQYIEEHAHEPISVGDLAEYAGVSTRSLFAGFRRFRNTSPMHFLKEVRLRRVHEELLRTPPSSGAVTTVAFRWGFSHLGHFTTDYKRRFGETPSETLQRS